MATVTTMVTAFGCHVNDIMVVVGPSVGVCCFKLDQDQALDFSRIHPDCVPDPESRTPHVNIRLANRYGIADPPEQLQNLTPGPAACSTPTNTQDSCG